ncbi:uncharacterized protein [Cicer arietinum]|uniref:Uncharacterized protein LOC101498147 n=1 Tax=Cicer arietinum TaxID=3827 RepID=A0A1S2Z2X7_CICAR|nr:uncharacterized protein LOC101498147 [Cicer arietinum]
MASTNRSLIFATLMLTTCILMLGISGQLECGGNLNGIVTQCRQYVEFSGPIVQPSEACCQALNGADITCYCKYATPRIERMISMEKAMFVVNSCHCRNIPTDQCGSYTIPHPPPAKA